MKTNPQSLTPTINAGRLKPRRSEGWAAIAIATVVGLAPAAAQEEPAATVQAAPAPLSIALNGVLGAQAPVGTQAPAAIPLAPALAAGAVAAPAAPSSGAIVLPGPRVAAAAAAAPVAAPAAAPQPPAAAPSLPLGGIWPLDISRVADGRAQFRGERDSLEFALFVPPGAPPRELTVAAVSSAFILPSRSSLRVYAGDNLIGETPLHSITGVETLTFPLQPGALAPGLNRIRIEVQLAHRLFCGALPSYDLWTRVDLSRSGVAYDPAATPAGPAAFLVAANAARADGQPIVIEAGTPAQGAADVREISRQLGRILGGGLTFAMGEHPTGQGEPAAPIVELVEGGPSGVRFRKNENGAQILEVRAENGVVPRLFETAHAATVTDATPRLQPDALVPLSMLGFSTVRISQHLWTRDVAFLLPTDWLMNVRERAVLNLGYAYVPGMPTGAELRVLVNGAVVRIIPLDRGGRLDPAPLEVRFDAGLLQAGRNVLGFETFVPGDPADQPCLTAAVDRIEIRDSSTLIVPGTPKMHVAGIPHWMAGGGAMKVEAAANAVLGGDDGAQAAMHLNLAAALHGAGVSDPSQPPRRLVVLRPTDLSSAVFGEFGMGRQAMLAALQRSGPETPAAAAGLGAAQAATGLSAAQPATSAPVDAPLTFTVERTGYVDRAIDGVRALGRLAWMSVGRLAVPDPVADLGDWLSRQRGQAILFQLDKAAPDDLHLLISEDADVDAVLTGLSRAAERGAPLEGHVAVLGWDDNWITWTDETRLPVLEEGLNQRNWRGVVGNFASAQPRIFVGLLVGVALLSVLAANSYLAASRKQR